MSCFASGAGFLVLRGADALRFSGWRSAIHLNSLQEPVYMCAKDESLVLFSLRPAAPEAPQAESKTSTAGAGCERDNDLVAGDYSRLAKASWMKSSSMR